MVIRGVIGFLLSYICVLFVMPVFIRVMKKLSFKQSVSEYSLEEFKKKGHTPIMGGLLFILIPILMTIILAFSELKNLDLIIVFLAYIAYGAIGFVDDYLIAVKHNNDGLKPIVKFGMQLIVGIIFYLLYASHTTLDVTLLFSKKVIPFGFFYIFLIVLMFAGSSNAVNLTDGMDGLAAGCSVAALVPYMVFAAYQEKVGIVIFVACLLGALFGYLHFNVKPAKIFMGDTGALALGAVLAALAMVLKKEMSLIVIGGVFVIETLCVMLQIGSVKLFKKRIFPYTPIHYTFRIKGMDERKIVMMFWVVSIVFAIIGFFLAI